MPTRTRLPPGLLDGRVLVLAPDAHLLPALRALGLRAELAPDPNAALHGIIGADVILDPFQLVIGGGAQLAAGLARSHLLAPPRLMADGGLPDDGPALHAALASAFGPRAVQAAIEIAGIDSGAGLANVGGDRAFYLRLLERFWRAQQGAGALATGHALAGRWPELMRMAHTLRGSAAGVGASALHGAASTVERQVRQDGAASRAAVQTLAACLEAIVCELERYFASLDDAGQQLTLGTAQARTAQAKLVVMLNEFSGDTLDYFDECRASLTAILPPATLDQLAQHLERYEFDAARGLLDGQLPETG